MKSFNCSRDCLNNLLLVFKELRSPYYAHLSNDKSIKETLYEHSELVSAYCLKLVDKHGLESVLDSLIEQLILSLQIKDELEWGNQLKEIFLAAIAYHDLGKVNPNFQILKMENNLFCQDKKLTFQSNHSLLGSYVFSNIFFKKVAENQIFDED
ncbi:MAG: CRISPR-associated endonuclease Cas3'', partial [Bacteroidales bacterium]|nr:CRISPR-associated endonuclease Cas3'' [Bacteroidales bacterium]